MRSLTVMLLCVLASTVRADPSRPNILWITAEDMSPTLGCYGDRYAATPHLDRLAAEGVRFTRAFATAPVCSPARSCLITGCYAPSLGTQQMRSQFPIPESMQGFPARLRKHGYYTTNNVKTDYNTANSQQIVNASWDESTDQAHWRHRASQQPFFSVFNLMTTHQSRTMTWARDRFIQEVQSQLSADEVHQPETVPLPPYYPDTLVTRRVVARYYDCVRVMDKQVGAILQQLEEDGLAEDTIVFFYSDHGSGMPGHKRFLLDRGLRVPLLVRFPAKYAQLAPVPAGNSLDRLVSFVDFAPTVLSLAGVEIPQAMQGQPFLGSAATPPRDYVYAHRDRIDESIDVARAVRDQRYLYVRNFMPHLACNPPSWWPDMGEINHEFYRAAQGRGSQPPVQQLLRGSRPAEELYDCMEDPANLHNLANLAEHRPTLGRLRQALFRHLESSGDVGFVPESMAWKLFGRRPAWEVVRAPHDSHSRWDASRVVQLPLLAARHVGGDSDPRMATRLGMLQGNEPAQRYWGAIAFHRQRSLSSVARQALWKASSDEFPAVRIEAAHALARHGEMETALPVLLTALEDDDLNVVLHATRTVELLGPLATAAIPAMQQVALRAERLRATDAPATFVLTAEQDLAMFCSFSANNFLRNMQEGNWLSLLDSNHHARWSGHEEHEAKFSSGEVQLDSQGKNLWISHAREFDDFELTVEVKMPPGEYNSGIGFRCRVAKNGRPRGYQCEIDEQQSGGLFAIQSGGWIWPRGEEQTTAFHQRAKDAFRSGKWNHFRVRCEEDTIQIWVNGTLATDIRDERHAKGKIALQHHGKGGTHRFRELHVRPLKSLAGAMGNRTGP